MATNTTRKSSGKAAPSKDGAASAASTDESLTVEQDTPITVDAPAPEAADTVEADATVQTREGAVPAALVSDEPKITEGVTATEGTVEEPKVEPTETPQAETVEEPLGVDVHVGELAAAGRDMAALQRLADTSGRPSVTPYPAADGVDAPAPVVPLPELRDSFVWAAEGDATLTGRVVVDGWRPRINGSMQFASRGDRVTAPADVIRAAAARGSLIIENQE